MPAPKVLVIFGTRPEAIKLFPVIRELRRLRGVQTRTCVTGQHRGLLDQVLAVANVTPDIDLDLMTPGQSLDALTGRLLAGVGAVLDGEKPDRVIVQGDTATAMVGALASHYRRIPVSHVEAGLRSGDIYQPWPEEVNRRIVTAIADQHFAPTVTAADALRRENVTPATIHVTGNTVIDALYATRDRIETDPGLTAGLDALLRRLSDKRIVLVTTHRRENFGEGIENIVRALDRIAERTDTAILFPVHPNPNIAAAIKTLRTRANVACIEPLDYPSFVRALSECDIVLSDSGGVQEEAPALGKPVLVMRETTERPEGVVAGTARLVGTNEERIVSELWALLESPTAHLGMAGRCDAFGDGKAAPRIARLIASKLQ